MTFIKLRYLLNQDYFRFPIFQEYLLALRIKNLIKSFYVNFPAVVAESSQIEKGEIMEWIIEDRNTFVLKRVKPKKTVLQNNN